MELFFYIFIFLLSLIFSLSSKVIKQDKIFFSFWSITYISLVLIVRSEFDEDIVLYARVMTYENYSLYHFKEPVIWLGHKILFRIYDDPFVVFLLTDTVIGILLFRSFKNLNLPQYLYFSILIFFPFIMGMQNAYRQWVSSILFLYSFSLIWNYNFKAKSFLFFGLSILTHNVAALMLPIYFLKNNVRERILWFLALIISFLGVYFGANIKSSHNTGADLRFLYLALMLFILLAIPIVDRGIIKRVRKHQYKLIVTLIAISLFGLLQLSSASSERLSMFCLMILYPIIAMLIEDRFKVTFPIRMLFTFLGFCPIFLFSISKLIL